jgi:hypothetical protein
VRAECLDRLLILNRRHLERVLRIYVDHDNREGPHRALELRPPNSTSDGGDRQKARSASRPARRSYPRVLPSRMRCDRNYGAVHADAARVRLSARTPRPERTRRVELEPIDPAKALAGDLDAVTRRSEEQTSSSGTSRTSAHLTR